MTILGVTKEPDPFPVHKIMIQEASWDDDRPDYVYDLIHPDECEDHKDCSVYWDLHESNLWEALCGYAYPSTQQTYPWCTTYYVRTWVTHYPANPNHADEWDQGLYVGFTEDEV